MVAVIGKWSLFGGGRQLRFDCNIKTVIYAFFLGIQTPTNEADRCCKNKTTCKYFFSLQFERNYRVQLKGGSTLFFQKILYFHSSYKKLLKKLLINGRRLCLLFCLTSVVYFIDVWGRQVWLSVVYTACLLDNIHTVRIDCFTKWDRDRLSVLESIFTIKIFIIRYIILYNNNFM